MTGLADVAVTLQPQEARLASWALDGVSVLAEASTFWYLGFTGLVFEQW